MDKQEAYEIVLNHLKKNINTPEEVYEALKLLKYEEHFIH